MCRKDNVLELWSYLLELLRARRLRLELSLKLQKVFQEMLYILDWMDEIKVGVLPVLMVVQSFELHVVFCISQRAVLVVDLRCPWCSCTSTLTSVLLMITVGYEEEGNLHFCRHPCEYLSEYTSQGKPNILPADQIPVTKPGRTPLTMTTWAFKPWVLLIMQLNVEGLSAFFCIRE